MKKVNLRYQRISDAERFYEILNNPNFVYFQPKPKSVIEYNYSIIYDGQLIGACGVRIHLSRSHIGEIGYFIDETYWGMGLASQAVKQLEKVAFNKLRLKRLEIIVMQKNKPSIRVATRNNYKCQF